MQTYNIKVIKRISDHISPAVARAIEIWIIAGVSYILWAIIDWNVLSWNAVIVAVITPVWSATNKYLRDKQKEDASKEINW